MRWEKLRRGLFFSGMLVFLLAFPYGPLFPWSPWKPGYEHLALQRADIYWPTGTALQPAYRQFDELIARTEQFEDLECTRRITVVECATWTQFRRLMPHMSTRGLAAITLATGAQIYITPKLDEKKLDHREFLLHELGHALVNQHQTLVGAMRFSKIDWLSEGIAVANGKQKAYLSFSEMRSRARREPLGPVIDPDRRQGLLDMRFAYPVWRYFNEHLMTVFGRDRYHRYLVAVAADPPRWREQFQQSFGRSFDDEIASFEDSLRATAR